MIVVRIERWRDSSGRNTETLGVLKIVDDRTGNEDVSNLEVTVETNGKTSRSMRVEGHRNAGGFWLLVYDVLKQLIRPTVSFASGSKPSVPPR